MAAVRHKLREQAMTSLYQHLLLKKDIREAVYDVVGTNEIDPFLYTITIDAVKYKDSYIIQIDAQLRDGWTFERLGFVDRSILLLACCEIDLETAPKAIVINEAITLAKRYCDDDTYKLVNGVLDRL